MNHSLRWFLGSYALSLLLLTGGASAQCFISAPALLSGQHPISIAAADFNGDGHLDFVTANPPQAGISIALGHGDGSFSPAYHQLVGFQPWYVIAADLNDD